MRAMPVPVPVRRRRLRPDDRVSRGRRPGRGPVPEAARHRAANGPSGEPPSCSSKSRRVAAARAAFSVPDVASISICAVSRLKSLQLTARDVAEAVLHIVERQSIGHVGSWVLQPYVGRLFLHLAGHFHLSLAANLWRSPCAQCPGPPMLLRSSMNSAAFGSLVAIVGVVSAGVGSVVVAQPANAQTDRSFWSRSGQPADSARGDTNRGDQGDKGKAARLYAEARADIDGQAAGAQRKLEVLVARSRQARSPMWPVATCNASMPARSVRRSRPSNRRSRTIQLPPPQPFAPVASQSTPVQQLVAPVPAPVREASEDFRHLAGDRIFFADSSIDLGGRAKSALEHRPLGLPATPASRSSSRATATTMAAVIQSDVSEKRAYAVKLRLNDLGVGAERIRQCRLWPRAAARGLPGTTLLRAEPACCHRHHACANWLDIRHHAHAGSRGRRLGPRCANTVTAIGCPDPSRRCVDKRGAKQIIDSNRARPVWGNSAADGIDEATMAAEHSLARSGARTLRSPLALSSPPGQQQQPGRQHGRHRANGTRPQPQKRPNRARPPAWRQCEPRRYASASSSWKSNWSTCR